MSCAVLSFLVNLSPDCQGNLQSNGQEYTGTRILRKVSHPSLNKLFSTNSLVCHTLEFYFESWVKLLRLLHPISQTLREFSDLK
jgi:hypothetical protein